MTETTLTSDEARFPGGVFLVRSAGPGDVFTPEDLAAEQRQFAAAAASFAERSVLPVIQQIEEKQAGLMSQLLREAGDMGLLGVDVPEQYGGLALDKVTSTLIAEEIAVSGSFYVAFSAHAGIGTLPLVWYGTEAQKKKYLPKLATGELIAAYALSEASSGSDATNIRANAVLSPDGSHYLLNGEKMWISNAGIADLFTIFVKVDGKQFSAFLVDRSSPGLSIGPEEHKMGIRGSSTCPVILNDCKVPVENLLGQIGKGHQIAFNVLNAGRFKLGAVSVGAAKSVFRGAVRYGKERTAFGKHITDFGLIQEKLSDSAARIFAGEALLYRVVGSIDKALEEVNADDADAVRLAQQRIEEHVVECSIVKVWCSEMQERVTDHALQIYGGYGFTEEYPVARMYRDSRVNKIFEGTNEVNRLLITRWTLKKAAGEHSELAAAIAKTTGTPRESVPTLTGAFAEATALVANTRELILYCFNAAQQKYGQGIADEQEVAGALADLIIENYVLESALLRAVKRGDPLMADLVQYYTAGIRQQIVCAAERILAAAASGDMAKHTEVLGRLTQHAPVDSIAIGKRIAKAMIEAGKYDL